MIDKLMDALNNGKITSHDLESAEKLFRFLADALQQTRVELAVQGYEPKIEQLVRARQIIPAIKEYRQHTNAGLKEAKDAVEAIAERLGVRRNGEWVQ
jgi:ribosomal protein L7/L12